MTGDFNIRDNLWDPNFLHHSLHMNVLLKITDSFQLDLSKPTEFFHTRYLDNSHNSNSVIDLMFLQLDSEELNNYLVHPDWRLTSDHAPLSVKISILKEHIQTKKRSLVKNSEEENHFVIELMSFIKGLKMDSI